MFEASFNVKVGEYKELMEDAVRPETVALVPQTAAFP